LCAYFINDPTAGGGLVEEKRKENAAISNWDFSFYYVLSPSLTLCWGGKNDISVFKIVQLMLYVDTYVPTYPVSSPFLRGTFL
jgi:hypothetical protein